MKTPEEVAREVREKSASQAYRHHPKWLMSESLIAAAIAERDKRADALAEALRELVAWDGGEDHNDMDAAEWFRTICRNARAALAAYDAEAK